MLKELVKIANRLDSLGLSKEADILDSYIQKLAADGEEVEWGGSSQMPKKTQYEKVMGQKPQYGPNLPQSAKDDAMAVYDKHNDLVRIANTTDKERFKKVFKDYYNLEAKEENKDYAESMADWMWNKYGTKEAPAPAKTTAPPNPPKPGGMHATPKVKDQPTWESYVARVPGGDEVKKTWEASSASLGSDNDFNSFRGWLRGFMSQTGKTNISAKDLAYFIAAISAVSKNKPALKEGLMQAIKDGNKERVSRYFSTAFSDVQPKKKEAPKSDFARELEREME